MRLTPLILAMALPGSALANEYKAVTDWLTPQAAVVESFAAKPVYLYDSKSSGGTGLRLGARWAIPLIPDAITLRVNYLQLPSTKYDFPEYNENNPHSQAKFEDIFDAIEGRALRDGDRRRAGFPGHPFKMTWEPRGIEIGTDARLPMRNDWYLGVRIFYIYDLSSVPKLEGFSISNAKLKRSPAQSYGISLSKRVGNLEAGVFYDRFMFTSYVTGDPQAWNEAGGNFLHGRRSHDSAGLSLGFLF